MTVAQARITLQQTGDAAQKFGVLADTANANIGPLLSNLNQAVDKPNRLASFYARNKIGKPQLFDGISWDDPETNFEHLRPMGTSHKNWWTGRARHGYGQYFMGTGPVYMLASAVFQSLTYVMPPTESMTRMPWLVK